MLERLSAWGSYGVALSAFLAGGPVSAPSEPVLVAAIAAGGDPVFLVLLATAANVAGAAVLLALGRWSRVEAERRAGPKLARWEASFKKYGASLLLLSWLPFVGDLIVLAGGVLRVRWALALPLLALGKGARYAAVAAGAAWLVK